MANYVIAYDVRAKNHEYQSLYDQLNEWRAAHLQNSVWLATLNGSSTQVRDVLRTHMHQDDTLCVIELGVTANWATWAARETGIAWLKAHYTNS